MIAIAFALGAAACAEARIPALEDDSLFLGRIETGKGTEPKVYVWAATGPGPMFPSARSDTGAWWLYSLSVSASTDKGWLLTIRFPELGIPPPNLFRSHDSAIVQDSLLGFSLLAGKRKR